LGTSAIPFQTLYVKNVNSTLPSCASAFSSGGGTISFTSGTGKPIAATFVSSYQSSDLTVTTGSGLYTYSGAVTRFFRVSVDFSMTPLNTTNTLQVWITKNGSLTAADYTAWTFEVLAVAPDFQGGFSVSRLIQLANTDTFQFSGLLNATTNVKFNSIKYVVTAVA